MSVRALTPQTSPARTSSMLSEFDLLVTEPGHAQDVPAGLRRYVGAGFALVSVCSLFLAACFSSLPPLAAKPSLSSVGGSNVERDAPANGAHEFEVWQPRRPEDSWSFDLEPTPRVMRVSGGAIFDPSATPDLYSQGCEDAPGWGNGYLCSEDTLLIDSLGGDAPSSRMCSAAGFTCAAYAVGGWCKETWALGPFSNFPEKNCCACGGGTSVAEMTAGCGRATEQCAKAVEYAMYIGIREHPDRYPGLTRQSTFEEVQKYEHVKNFENTLCPLPCSAAVTNRGMVSHDVSDDLLTSTHQLMCPARSWNLERSGPGFCFAQLANNSGAVGYSCTCRQGCDPKSVLLANTIETVTFKNKKGLGVSRACSADVLLTIPREFYRDYADALKHCGREGLISLFEVLLRDSFAAYNTHLCHSALWQCFHSPRTASVPYLHMQTFSAAGFFHGMPTSNKAIAICVKQSAAEESAALARKLVAQV